MSADLERTAESTRSLDSAPDPTATEAGPGGGAARVASPTDAATSDASDGPRRIPDRAYLIALVAAAVLFALALTVVLLIWYTPPVGPTDVPRVPQA